jgi:hypothetical protein
MTQDTSTATRKKRGSIHKVAAIDIGIAEEVFKNALHLLIPEDAKQRKVFESLMPYLFVLRNKGCSWEQLTSLLNECGFKLQPSTVRNYFSEMQQVNMDLCQERMNEQILLLNEVKKQTRGIDISTVAGQINGIMDKQRTAAATKVQALFGGQLAHTTQGLTGIAQSQENQPATPASLNPPEPASPAHAKTGEPASPAHAKTGQPASPARGKTGEPASPARQKTGAGLRPAPEQQEEQSSFGMLTVAPTEISATRSGFLDLDDEPTIPVIAPLKENAGVLKPGDQPVNSKTDTSQDRELKCKPLTKGVKPLTVRANVPSEVYTDVTLEHPAIDGLMLTSEERMYGAALEYVNQDGEIRTESIHEKRFRVMWQKPVVPTPTTTSKNFTDIDPAYFKSTD